MEDSAASPLGASRDATPPAELTTAAAGDGAASFAQGTSNSTKRLDLTGVSAVSPIPQASKLPDSPGNKSVSPIAARSWWVALLAALPPLAMLLFLHWNPYLVVLIAAAVTIAVAITWGGLSQAPSPVRTGIVVAITGIGCLLATFITTNLTWVPLVLSWCLLAAFIAEMTRGKHRPLTTWSLSSTITGCALVAAGSAWGLATAYPTMNLLAMAALPAMGLACLSLALPTKHASIRWMYCVLSGTIAAGLLTYFVLYGYSDLALAIPFAYRNPSLAIWTMTLGMGFGSGLLVACINVLFMVPAGKNYRWRQLALALLPTLFISVPIYSLARLITG